MKLSKSIVCTDFGGIESIEVIDVPLKELNDNEVEVEVHYCGLNFADLYTRLGLFPKKEKPFVLGIECSGIVKSLGKNVTKFKINDRVVCYNYNGGLHREIITIPASHCYIIPDSISLKTAAAAFVAFLTAHCALFEAGSIAPGHHVLIQSCAGAVGCAATQLARTVPQVTVWGTTSNAEKLVTGLVDHVFQYNEYLNKIEPNSIDIIIDNQACYKYNENLKLLKTFGKIIVTGANYMIQDDSISVGGIHLGLIAERAPEQLQKSLNHIWKLLINHDIEAQIDSVWPFHTDAVRSATKLLQNRQNKAKVLIQTAYCADLI